MNKFEMVRMLEEAKQALSETGLLTGKVSAASDYTIDEGSKSLLGQLILASAIKEALSNSATRR